MKEKTDFNIKVDFTGLWELAMFVTVVFVVLRLTKLIMWGWVWVLFPLIVVAGLYVIVLLIFLIVAIYFRLRDNVLD